MVLYLIVLAMMTLGSTALSFLVIQRALYEKQMGIYDARGFYLVILIFVTFLLISLAYYWGDSRFEVGADKISEPIIGVLFSLCCNLAGLTFGLMSLKETDPLE